MGGYFLVFAVLLYTQSLLLYYVTILRLRPYTVFIFFYCSTCWNILNFSIYLYSLTVFCEYLCLLFCYPFFEVWFSPLYIFSLPPLSDFFIKDLKMFTLVFYAFSSFLFIHRSDTRPSIDPNINHIICEYVTWSFLFTTLIPSSWKYSYSTNFFSYYSKFSPTIILPKINYICFFNFITVIYLCNLLILYDISHLLFRYSLLLSTLHFYI